MCCLGYHYKAYTSLCFFGFAAVGEYWGEAAAKPKNRGGRRDKL